LLSEHLPEKAMHRWGVAIHKLTRSTEVSVLAVFFYELGIGLLHVRKG
jgi:hypothetical protein